MGAYSNGNQGDRWWRGTDPYIKNTQVLKCPSFSQYRGYGCNYNLSWWQGARTLADLPNAAGTAYTLDAAQCSTAVIGKAPQDWLAYQGNQDLDWQWMPPGTWDGAAASPNRYDNTDGNYTRRPMPRHNEGLNVGYCDGHVKWAKIDAFVGPMPLGHAYGTEQNAWDNR
jgi:prepilin-type processing-associated H-X9-DG protein